MAGNDDVDRYVDRWKELGEGVDKAVASMYTVAFAAPAVAVGLLGLSKVSGPTSVDVAKGQQQLAYIGLVVAANIVLLHSCVQMRFVWVSVGLRRAIEDFLVDLKRLPAGLYRWETGPAVELSGFRNLDGGLNFIQLLSPTLALGLQVGVSGFGLIQLWILEGPGWLFLMGATLSLLILLLTGVTFARFPHVAKRVNDWARLRLSNTDQPPRARPTSFRASIRPRRIVVHAPPREH